MDYFLTLLFLIISCVIGIGISLFLKIKSYFWIAIICTIIFISIELYHNYKSLSNTSTQNSKKLSLSIQNLVSRILSTNPDNLSLPTGLTISANGNLLSLPGNNTIPDYHIRKPEEGNRFATQKDLDNSNYSIFKHPQPVFSTATPTTTLNATVSSTTTPITIQGQDNNNTNFESPKGLLYKGLRPFEIDKPPFDGLQPNELLSRLNYIYYATANPAKMINYHDFKTHADKMLEQDGTKLSTNDLKLQTYSAGFYPQLTADQIDARDCLNEGSGARSCFQSPQLFHNVKHNFNIMEKGVNLDNANLVVREDFGMTQNLASSSLNFREDFSMPMQLNPSTRYDPVLFVNAPRGNLDKPLDQQSNESIDLSADTISLCHNCKLAVCKDDYCSLNNKLFM
jgi:hypothetical protein